MFRVEKNNEKIGKYLSSLIEQKYVSRRAFCREYISVAGEEPNDERVNNMSNRLSQIIKGKKAIQTYDLPYFTELLGVSCEQILSAGECVCPIVGRVTNYTIACSNDPVEWEKYINRTDKLILNTDEYCKTVLDYALDFGNYEFLRYLIDNKYIWFDSGDERDYFRTFGAGTSIERRHFDDDLVLRLMTKDELRTDLITLAVEHNDFEMLDYLRAKEIPQLYFAVQFYSCNGCDFDGSYNEKMVEHIAKSDEFVLDYFTDSFEFRDYKQRTYTFMFPYISKLLDMLILLKSPFVETALKKALNYNEGTYKKLCKIILSSKNDERYTDEFMKKVWFEDTKHNFAFDDNGNIVSFKAFYSKQRIDGLVTNVPHVTTIPSSPILKHLVEELNDSYEKIKNITEHLEDFDNVKMVF